MYIPEFFCGVLATLAVEFLAAVVYGITSSRKKKESGNKDK